MIIHNVYFWLKAGTTEIDKVQFEKGMIEFMEGVDEINDYHICIPATTPQREVVDNSFEYSLFVKFESVEDHNIYQSHPVHDKFVESFKDLWARVEVHDSDIL